MMQENILIRSGKHISSQLAYDLMIVGKAANDVDAIKEQPVYCCSLIRKVYPRLIISFERGSPRFIALLKAKVDEGDLKEKDFAVFCKALLFISRAQGPDLLKINLRLRSLACTKAWRDEIF